MQVGDQVGVLTAFEPKKRRSPWSASSATAAAGTRIGGVNEVAFTTPVAQRLMLGEPDVFTSITVRAADGVSDEAAARRRGAAPSARPTR